LWTHPAIAMSALNRAQWYGVSVLTRNYFSGCDS